MVRGGTVWGDTFRTFFLQVAWCLDVDLIEKKGLEGEGLQPGRMRGGNSRAGAEQRWFLVLWGARGVTICTCTCVQDGHFPLAP